MARRSSVDMSKVDFNTFVAVYGPYASLTYPDLDGLKLRAREYFDWLTLGGKKQKKLEEEYKNILCIWRT